MHEIVALHQEQDRIRDVCRGLVLRMKSDGDLDIRFVNFLKGLPSLVRQNGIGQVLAFLSTKGGAQYMQILEIMKKHIDARGELKGLAPVRSSSVNEYLEIQRIAVLYSKWLKEFAVAFHEEEESQNASAS